MLIEPLTDLEHGGRYFPAGRRFQTDPVKLPPAIARIWIEAELAREVKQRPGATSRKGKIINEETTKCLSGC